MFMGGTRAKRTSLLTNVPGIGAILEGMLCMGKEICDRTGEPHESWKPDVVRGVPVRYPTADEAEYPAGLCSRLAEVIGGLDTDAEHSLVFTEVFSGPRAPLSFAVARRLCSSASSCSSW